MLRDLHVCAKRSACVCYMICMCVIYVPYIFCIHGLYDICVIWHDMDVYYILCVLQDMSYINCVYKTPAYIWVQVNWRGCYISRHVKLRVPLGPHGSHRSLRSHEGHNCNVWHLCSIVWHEKVLPVVRYMCTRVSRYLCVLYDLSGMKVVFSWGKSGNQVEITPLANFCESADIP